MKNKAEYKTENEVEYEVENEVEYEVENEVEDEIEDEVEDNIKNEVEDKIENETKVNNCKNGKNLELYALGRLLGEEFYLTKKELKKPEIVQAIKDGYIVLL